MPNPTLQDSIHDWQSEEGQTDATMLAGQLEVIANELLRAADASLDLAYEQRTANLIAYLDLASRLDLAYHPSVAVLKSVQADIEERLGLA